jgi:hypothetical protein
MLAKKAIAPLILLCLLMTSTFLLACKKNSNPIPLTPVVKHIEPTSLLTEFPTLTPVPTHTPTPEPAIWNVVAFGDKSIISEAGADSYATYYASYVAEDLGVNVEIVFYTIEDVLVKDQLDRLRNDESLRDAIRNAQVVTIATGDLDIIYPIIGSYLYDSCGGDDNKDCIREALEDFQNHYNKLLDEILLLCSSGTMIRTMTLPTRSLHEIYGSDEDLQPFYIRLNNLIIEASQAHDIPVVMVHELMSDTEESIANGYIDPAGWSPTASGAELIAELHRNRGYELTCP